MKAYKKNTMSISAFVTALVMSAAMLTSCSNEKAGSESGPDYSASSSSGSTAVSSGTKGADGLSIQDQKVVDSPEWLTKLDAVKDTDQIIVVAGVGDTTAYVSMHEKNADGKWKMVLQMPGYIGLEGMGDADCNHAITPIGTFTVGKAFGIADDPGCPLGYTKVTEDDYWSGDMRDGMHFNEFVNINDVPGLDPEECEHIIDYTYEYQYCLDMGYNTECVYEEGSCFFFHCMSLVKPYTGGCVAVSEATMKLIMQRVKPGCKITINTADALGIDLNEARTAANEANKKS